MAIKKRCRAIRSRERGRVMVIKVVNIQIRKRRNKENNDITQIKGGGGGKAPRRYENFQFFDPKISLF